MSLENKTILFVRKKYRAFPVGPVATPKFQWAVESFPHAELLKYAQKWTLPKTWTFNNLPFKKIYFLKKTSPIAP